MQKAQAESLIELEIREKLHNYPVFEKAKTVSFVFNLGLFFLFIILAHVALFINGDGFNTGLIEAVENAKGWNIVLAGFSVAGMFFFMIKTFSIPPYIGWEIKSVSLKKMLEVAEYNPNVKSYLESNKKMTFRDYYYLNINEQLIIIRNIKGLNELKQGLQIELEVVSSQLEKELQSKKIKPFIAQAEIISKAKSFKKKGFTCLALVIGIIVVANLVNMQFTPAIRGSLILICFTILIVMLCLFSMSGRLKDNETTPIEDKDYMAVKKLCMYSQDCRLYIASVIQEGRVLNQRDLDALSVYEHLEKIEYINLTDRQFMPNQA